MISQWWRVFISPQKKPRPQNNDKSPHMSHLKQVAKMGSLISPCSVPTSVPGDHVEFPHEDRSWVKFVKSCAVGWLFEGTCHPKNLMYECFFQELGNVFVSPWCMYWETIEKLCFSITHALKHHQSGSTFRCFQSVPWPHDLNISISATVESCGNDLKVTYIALKQVTSNPRILIHG